MARQYKTYGHFSLVVSADEAEGARQSIENFLTTLREHHPNIRFTPQLSLGNKINVFPT